MAQARYYHKDYRQAEATAIVQALDRGQSVSVIGPPSVGKSNLLRFLDQDRLAFHDPDNPWTRYAPHIASEGPIVAVAIDPNALLPSLPADRGPIAAQAWPGFELLTHRTSIMAQLYPQVFDDPAGDPDPELAEAIAGLRVRFENAHPDVTDVEDTLHAHMALRHLENIIDAALNAHHLQNRPIRLAYIFDEFERVLDAMPDYFFVALRSIRDRFKYQVMFVTFTRNSLPYLIDEARMAAIEPFVELFHDSTVYLRPFNDDDAWRMIEQLENRSVSKDDFALGLLIRATGGYAGLLRAGFQHVDKLATIQAEEYRDAVALAAQALVAETNIAAECQTLLRGLNHHELRVLFGQPVEPPALREATTRELVHKTLLASASQEGVTRLPPVLDAYIRGNPQPPAPRPVTPPVTLPR